MHVSKKVAIPVISLAALASVGTGTALASTSHYTPPNRPPVINPFAGCNVTTTHEATFDPRLGRNILRTVPSITCVDRHGVVTVFIESR